MLACSYRLGGLGVEGVFLRGLICGCAGCVSDSGCFGGLACVWGCWLTVRLVCSVAYGWFGRCTVYMFSCGYW